MDMVITLKICQKWPVHNCRPWGPNVHSSANTRAYYTLYFPAGDYGPGAKNIIFSSFDQGRESKPYSSLTAYIKGVEVTLSYESGTRTLLREEAVCKNILQSCLGYMSLSGQDQHVREWGESALFEEDICFTLRGEHEEEGSGRRGGDDCGTV